MNIKDRYDHCFYFPCQPGWTDNERADLKRLLSRQDEAAELADLMKKNLREIAERHCQAIDADMTKIEVDVYKALLHMDAERVTRMAEAERLAINEERIR